MKELKDTIELMTSEDYKERFRAEFEQTKIRCEKLGELLVKHGNGVLPFTPSCPIALLDIQHRIMSAYLRVLVERAEFEGVDLDNNCE